MGLTSPAPFRHRFYEIFLHVHQALAVVAVWGIYGHMSDGYRERKAIITAVIAIWSYEVRKSKPTRLKNLF
jgi:hypothetical protein